MKFRLSILFALIGAGQARAQTTSADSIAAVAAVATFHAALAAGDSVRVVGLLAPDVLVIEAGEIQTRGEYLSSHLRADIQASQGSKGVRAVVGVTVAGSMAHVTSRTLTTSTGAQGTTVSESVELIVLGKVGSEWKIQAVHWSSRRRRS